MLSPQRRNDIVDALRRGTVPTRGLDCLAVGLERFEPAILENLDAVERGSSVFKAIRGEYGSGKTFLARWMQERARSRGWATAEVPISETETPLHRLETVYRRMMERLATAETAEGALRSVVDGWFYALEQDVLAEGQVQESQTDLLMERSASLMESRLADIHRMAPAFAAALRGYRQAVAGSDTAGAEGILAWLAGQPNVGASVKRVAGLRGEVDHFGALCFLQGLLVALRDSGRPGLLVVLDEVETLQRVRGDVRDRGLNSLRQLIDDVDSGRFPGLYLVVTGTPSFFDGPQGVQRLPPLAQRLHVDFATDARFDNPRAVQVRLPGFSQGALEEVGNKVRDLYVEHSRSPERLRRMADDAYVSALACAVTGELGGRVGVAPRIFLKKLVADVLDRIDQFPEFDPRVHYKLTLADAELTLMERNARAATTPDDVELDL
ncbi:MAG: BREX system ATP-binding protein BrxD [Candidatus Wallbacteria bacterium]|nr:BREX system ATP-binding protein BrxD [Candidatus Wallbacteria bacterium]